MLVSVVFGGGLPIVRNILTDTLCRREQLDWLYKGDVESRFLDLREHRMKGTGEWLLRSLVFQREIRLWGRAIGNLLSIHIENVH